MKDSSANDFPDFIKQYCNHLSDLLSKIDTGKIAAMIGRLEQARETGASVFIIGNGGSAATASHMACDLSSNSDDGSGRNIRAVSLVDNVPLLTAIANDHGYDQIFVRQLNLHYRPNDVLIAISASGKSPNVVSAAEWVRSCGGFVIGLVGFDGGDLIRFCDVAIHVQTPPGEYGPVEDIHLMLDHLMYSWFRLKRLQADTRRAHAV
jgi:D-sedoheptulose 7-phosphate isomerase